MKDSGNDDLFLFEDDFDDLRQQSKQRVPGRAAKVSFKIPPSKPTDARWILPGEKIVFGNYKIEAGFFYFGTSLPAYRRDTGNFASLVNPNLSIPKKKREDAKVSLIPHVIDYAELTGVQRRKYVLWHAGGRGSENMYAWFALLFLYGLERRVLFDGEKGLVKHEELVSIREETERILVLYGGKSAEIKRVYSAFLSYLELKCGDRKLYDVPVPLFERARRGRGGGLPAYIETALYQCAVDGVPVNGELAYYWYFLDGGVRDSDLPVVHEEKFKKLFILRYNEIYGKGFLVKKAQKTVPIEESYYKPECDDLEYAPFAVPEGAAAVSGRKIYRSKLEKIAGLCEYELMPYARWYAKSGRDGNLSEGELKLPAVLWEDEEEKKAVLNTKKQLKDRARLIRAGELKRMFFKTVPFSKSAIIDLARSLETENIAFEPDIISFPFQVKEDDVFIAHILENKVPGIRSNVNYEFAKNLLELALSVFRFCYPEEKTFSWHKPVKLEEYFCERLRFYVNLMMHFHLPLQQCINRFKNVDKASKIKIIKYIQNDVLAGRETSYETVSVIEKLYLGFGFSEEELYSALHTGKAAPDAGQKAAITLDKDKIKQLQEDSDHVYNMLSSIFKDDDTDAVSKTESEPEAASGRNCFNFNEAEASFFKIIVSRSEWPRDELSEKAKQHNLMLGGLIEIINEAAYNEFDEPLVEGEETITVNMEIAEMMTEKL